MNWRSKLLCFPSSNFHFILTTNSFIHIIIMFKWRTQSRSFNSLPTCYMSESSRVESLWSGLRRCLDLPLAHTRLSAVKHSTKASHVWVFLLRWIIGIPWEQPKNGFVLLAHDGIEQTWNRNNNRVGCISWTTQWRAKHN